MVFFYALAPIFFIRVIFLIVDIPWWPHLFPPNRVRSPINSKNNPRINFLILSTKLSSSFFNTLPIVIIVIPSILSILVLVVVIELLLIVIVASVEFLFFLLNLGSSGFALIGEVVVVLSVFLLLFQVGWLFTKAGLDLWV
jgi:hypothetical protein